MSKRSAFNVHFSHKTPDKTWRSNESLTIIAVDVVEAVNFVTSSYADVLVSNVNRISGAVVVIG